MKIKALKNQQSGEVMIESAIILVPVLILLMAMLSLSFLYYQQSIMNSVATEIAADVAKKYKFYSVEVTDDTIVPDDYINTKMFRMNFAKGSIEDEHKTRVEDYATWRVALTSLGLDAEELEVDCTIRGTGIGRAVVKVTVKQKTTFFLSGILELAGITDSSTAFGATAYAECNDMIAYTSMINFTEYATSILAENGFGSVNNFYTSFKSFVENLME